MKTNGDYIISGGAEGKKRLDVLAGILQNSTKTLLETNGLTEGISFLDVGCGGGNVSLMAARMVGPQGRVTAVDFDPDIIELNKQDAVSLNADNITYNAMDAAAISFDNEFDIAYSRFLLSHLKDPLAVLSKMVKSVKPGGRIIVEDIHFAGHFCYPPNKAFQDYVHLFTEAAKQRGQNPDIGPALFSLFQEVGISEINFDVIQPVFNKGEGKRMAVITLDKIKDAVLAQGLADIDTITRILDKLDAFTKDESTIISLPRIFRVWGVKPN